MIEISKNNYIRAEGGGLDFNIITNPFPSSYDNYHKESLRAAEEIYDKKQGKLNLMYSGGVDSEYMLNVFLELGMEFTPIVIRLSNDYNQHDLINAFAFCQSKNITPKIIDVDFDHFVNSGRLYDVAVSMKNCKFQRCVVADTILSLDGTVLCGEGEAYIRQMPRSKDWAVTIFEHDYAWVNHYKNHGIIGTPHFHRYTPEMMIAFLTDQRMKDLADNLVPGKEGSESSKWIIYNRHSGYNLKERNKYHGYEVVMRSDIFLHDSIQELKFRREEWNGVYMESYYPYLERLCTQ